MVYLCAVPFESVTGLFGAVCVVLPIPHAVVHHELLLWCQGQHYHMVLVEAYSSCPLLTFPWSSLTHYSTYSICDHRCAVRDAFKKSIPRLEFI